MFMFKRAICMVLMHVFYSEFRNTSSYLIFSNKLNPLEKKFDFILNKKRASSKEILIIILKKLLKL